MTILYQADLALENGRFQTETTLFTAITISLLSHARAEPDDILPAGSQLNGWWGDSYAEQPGDRWGSRLWTLTGRPVAVALELAPQLVREALAWLLEDELADEVTCTAEQIGPNQIGLRIAVRRDGTDLVSPSQPWVLVL